MGTIGIHDEIRQYLRARVALIACACSVAWAALAGIASLTVGAVSGSLALLAFAQCGR